MTDKTKLDEKILTEQVKLLFQSTTSLLLINLSVAGALAYALWDVVPHSSIQLWTGLMLGMLVVRALLYISYQKRFKPEHVKRYSYFLVLGSACAGLIWGMAGVLLFPEGQLECPIFILFVLLAMSGGSTFTLSIYLPAYFAFSPISLLPISIKLISMGDSIHWTLTFGSLLYLGALTAFNIKINHSFEESLRLRYENLDLIGQLQV